MRGKSTKKANAKDRDTLRKEYSHEELGEGVRGKYIKRYRTGTNLVLLEPDVAKAFPTPEAVNEALRSLIEIAERSKRPTSRSTRRRSSAG